MIAQLVGPLSELASGWLKGKADAQAAKANLKLVEAEAKASIMKNAAMSESEWEKLMAQNANNSWADELYAVIFALPLVLAFAGDWGRDIVQNGFTALDACPDWYKAALGIILSATFASRQATKFFRKK
tara:strand:+ start:612 stop:998 length:387 start_codon:yes stop_codon:yes gene_type:complete